MARGELALWPSGTAFTPKESEPMPSTGPTTTEEPVAVSRVGESVWILRPVEALEGAAVDILRDRFLDAVDSGAENLVVDLSDADTIAAEAAATILAMADLMRGRNGSLWLAARWSEGAGHTLRVIDEHGRRTLLGVSAALDAALDRLTLDEAQNRHSGDDHHPSSETFTCP